MKVPTTLSITPIPGAPKCWTQHLYITPDGDYGVATFKYQTIKDDVPYFLQPAGYPEGFFQ